MRAIPGDDSPPVVGPAIPGRPSGPARVGPPIGRGDGSVAAALAWPCSSSAWPSGSPACTGGAGSCRRWRATGRRSCPHGQVLVHSLQAGVSLLEPGAGRRRRPPGRRHRSTYVAPEAVSLRLSDGTTSSEVGVNGEVAWRVGADPGVGPGSRAVRPGRLVGPRGGRARSTPSVGTPERVVATDLDGHPAWQITTTVAQVERAARRVPHRHLVATARRGPTGRRCGSTGAPASRCASRSPRPTTPTETPGPPARAWSSRPPGRRFVVELDRRARSTATDSEVPAPPALTEPATSASSTGPSSPGRAPRTGLAAPGHDAPTARVSGQSQGAAGRCSSARGRTGGRG